MSTNKTSDQGNISEIKPNVWQNNVTKLNANNLNLLTKQVVENKGDLAELSANFNEFKRDIEYEIGNDNPAESITGIKGNIYNLQTQLDTVVGEWDISGKTVAQFREDIEAELGMSETSTGTSIKDRLTSVEDSVGEIHETMDEYDQSISNLQDKIDSLPSTPAIDPELENRVNVIEEDVGQLNGSVTTLSSNVAAYIDRLAEMSGDVDFVSDSYTYIDQRVTTAESNITELQNNNYPTNIKVQTIDVTSNQSVLDFTELDLTSGNFLLYQLGVLVSQDVYTVVDGKIHLNTAATSDCVYTAIQLIKSPATAAVAAVGTAVRIETVEPQEGATTIQLSEITLDTEKPAFVFGNGDLLVPEAQYTIQDKSKIYLNGYEVGPAEVYTVVQYQTLPPDGKIEFENANFKVTNFNYTTDDSPVGTPQLPYLTDNPNGLLVVVSGKMMCPNSNAMGDWYYEGASIVFNNYTVEKNTLISVIEMKGNYTGDRLQLIEATDAEVTVESINGVTVVEGRTDTVNLTIPPTGSGKIIFEITPFADPEGDEKPSITFNAQNQVNNGMVIQCRTQIMLGLTTSVLKHIGGETFIQIKELEATDTVSGTIEFVHDGKEVLLLSQLMIV